ncbi:MAG: hypothetical protein RMM98_09400 [Acidobacteriota bacterium]|nr:hypothetical protein [Acidobacteriota bacterium]
MRRHTTKDENGAQAGTPVPLSQRRLATPRTARRLAHVAGGDAGETIKNKRRSSDCLIKNLFINESVSASSEELFMSSGQRPETMKNTTGENACATFSEENLVAPCR